MKFGEKLHLYQLPAWEKHYIPYVKLKALLKSALKHGSQSNTEPNFRDFSDCFDHGIAVVDTFSDDRHMFLTRKGKNFHEPYSALSAFGSFPSPSLDLLDHFQLKDICAVTAELRKDYLEFQWFCRLNQEATRRIYAKLQKVVGGQAFAQQYQEEMARRLEKQRYCEIQCLKQIDTLQTLIDELSFRASLSSQPNIQTMDLIRSPGLIIFKFDDRLQEIDISSHITAIDKYIRTDQASDLAAELRKIHSLIGEFDSVKFQAIFYRFLTLSISSQAWSCAKSLLAEEFAQGYLPRKHVCLSYLIGVIGRSWNNIDSEIVDQNFKEAGTNIFLRIVEHLGPGSRDVLTREDTVARLSLHYGAMYGLTTICRSILETLHEDTSVCRQAILAADDEGFTPLHWSVINRHVEITKLFLAALETADRSQEAHLRSTISALLLIALKYEDNDMVQLLAASGHIDINHQFSSGETVLYIAARLGLENYVDLLLKSASSQNAKIDTREAARGWTPLFIASVHGHLPVVKLLLQAGADGTLVDRLGWTARENAAFKGHLSTAKILPEISMDAESTMGSLIATYVPRGAKRTLKYQNLRRGCTYAVVNLGTMQTGKQISPTDLNFKSFVPSLNTKQPNTALLLEISAPGVNSARYLVPLPLLGDPVHDTFVFPLAENASEGRLAFKLFRADSTNDGQNGTLVGSGTALLFDSHNCFGRQRESLIRELSVPILEKETMDFLGIVTFTFVIAKPFPNLNDPTPSFNYLKTLDSVQLVGHRGLGQNVGGHGYLQLGENTVESFLSAAKLGASLVEFDVQMTRDLVPVLYHDFSLSESGTDVPIHDLTLDQFLYASNIQSPHGQPISVLGSARPRSRDGRMCKPARSRSLTRDHEVGAREIKNRMKHTVDFINKGFKPNTRGDFIQDSFATLEEALRKVPESIAFDMEIKYPRIHEALGASVAPVTIELNVFIDTILSVISRFAKGRNIILSSFTPEVCILLTLKQKAYPVLFITNAGKVPMADKEQRAASLQAAVRFATWWGLDGIVFASEVFVMCPRLVGYVKGKGLVCGSYGPQCNTPETVKLQVKAGVDLIVADRVGQIAKTLEDLSLA